LNPLVHSAKGADGCRAGFKKAVNRAGTQVMMKTGHVEKTVDRDYEIEERRYRTMESAANKLQREAKGYLDSLRGTTPKSGLSHSPSIRFLWSGLTY
jgi:BAR domain